MDDKCICAARLLGMLQKTSRTASGEYWVNRPEDLRSIRLRDILRHIALDGFAFYEKYFGDESLKGQNRVHFLLLHHVFAAEIDDFRKLLVELRRHYQFISYTEAVQRVLENRIDDAYLAFSFDDGQESCLNAAKVLEEFNASACFFLCPSIVGELNNERIAKFCREQLWHNPVKFMGWSEVESLKKRGHEIGGHTMGHVRLASPNLSLSEIEDEIGQSFQELTSRLGETAHFSWPYGSFRDITQGAAETVFRLGYRSCASGVRGTHVASKSKSSSYEECSLCVYRESIVAKWPLSHVLYFLNRSMRRPVVIENSWPAGLVPNAVISNSSNTKCKSHLTQSRSDPEAA